MTRRPAEIDVNKAESGTGPRSSSASASGSGRAPGVRWGGLSLDPTSALFVSLFLVLFAFFAVLNVNASEKSLEAEAVMASLHEAFGEGPEVPRDTGFAPDDLDASLTTAHAKIMASFPQARIHSFAIEDRIEVSLVLDSFFVDHTSRLAPSRELFLKSLATLSSNADDDPLEITLGFSAADADLDVQRKIAAMAATLGKYGVSPGAVTAMGTVEEMGNVRLILSRG